MNVAAAQGLVPCWLILGGCVYLRGFGMIPCFGDMKFADVVYEDLSFVVPCCVGGIRIHGHSG